ncbi:MAG: hypothetical protein DRG09_00025 [Epsilonproteobacteria bacterium]|nr:MAG: hypothetical protein DRG09_00025 [Campylobacterota bacterium]
MKKLLSVVTIVAVAMMSTPTTSSASLAKGQKLYKKKLRKYCRVSGVRFARMHTQDEWEEIYDDGDFAKETYKLCPKLKKGKIKKAWWDDIYEFTYEYGKGGSHVPKC